jgi:hypothetical protein
MSPRYFRALAAAVLLSVPVVATVPGTASADTGSVPFKDVNAVGVVGFCDKDNKPVTSGNIRDVPFAMKAVSSAAAPPAYAIQGRKAALYAYSPIKNVAPGDWSPYQMTMSSFYSNPAHPMSAATYRDPALEGHVTGVPPTWDGLVQMRLLLTAPNTMPRIQPYPAAVLRVTGDRWVMVAGDRTPACASGKATSITTLLLPASAVPTAPPSWAANAAKPTPTSTQSGSGASQGAAAGGPSDGQTTLDPADTNAAATESNTSSVAPIAALLLGATVVGVGLFAWFASRRDSSTPGSGHAH